MFARLCAAIAWPALTVALVVFTEWGIIASLGPPLVLQ